MLEFLSQLNFFTVPSALVLHSSPTVTSTTITITGSVPSGSVVTGFEVHWQRNTSVGCSYSNQRTITENQGFSGSYTITGLEPGNRYTITVAVFNAAGSAPVSNAVTATTEESGKRLKQYVYLLLIVVLHRSYRTSHLSQTWYSHCQ